VLGVKLRGGVRRVHRRWEWGKYPTCGLVDAALGRARLMRESDIAAEPAQALRVEPIGLGQLPTRLGEVISIARIDACDLNPRRPQREPGRPLVTARGLQHHQLGLQRQQSRKQLFQALLVIADGKTFSVATSRLFLATSIPTTRLP
jgi:hypothetical protein